MKLTEQLCSQAYSKRKGLNPGACQNCVSPCGYGREMLKEQGMDLPKHTPIPEFIRPTIKSKKLLVYMNRGM